VLWIAVALTQSTFTPSTWAMWVIAAFAMWILHPISLSAIRIAAPGVAAIALSRLPNSNFEPIPVATATLTVIALLLIYTSDYGSAHVQSGAYGNERRDLLRMPVSLILPTFLAWTVLFALLVSVDSFATQRQWLAAGGTGMVFAAAMWKLGRQLHRLSRRWLVRVPAGWVVHDGVLLAENLLIRTHQIVGMKMAPADTEAIDLSGVTRGIPIEISLRELTDVRLSPLLSKITKTVDVLHVKQLLIAPNQAHLFINK
jgi:hypothetical protein